MLTQYVRRTFFSLWRFPTKSAMHVGDASARSNGSVTRFALVQRLKIVITNVKLWLTAADADIEITSPQPSFDDSTVQELFEERVVLNEAN
jgi:hypothetical protein